MQAPTHLLTGVLIDQALPDIRSGYARQLVVGLLAIYSHATLDAVSALTYHPPASLPSDRFWLGYHTGLAALTGWVWAANYKQHKWAMICAVLPDLDWLLVKIPNVFGTKIMFWQQPMLHELLFKTLYVLPPVRLLIRLPNLRQRRAAAFFELALFLFLLGLYRWQAHRPQLPHRDDTRSLVGHTS